MNTDYLLKATSSRIDFYSADRLSLQPLGAMHRGREELRLALKELKPKPGYGLDASLTTLLHGCFDVENILFYNVGAARFRAGSNQGFSFRLHPAKPDCPSPFAYHHRYELLPLDAHSINPQLIFHLDRLNTKTKPHDIWWSARRGTRQDLPLSVEHFKLFVEIEGPISLPGLSAIAKPLVDGIVASLHHDSGLTDALAVSRLAKALAVTTEQACHALADTTATPLGPRKTLSAYRDFVKWNPADELCVDCSIRWHPSRNSKVRVAARIEPALW